MDLEKFVEDLKAVVRDGQELLKASATEVKERAVTGAKSTDRLIRNHPYQTLGIVFGLGLIAGLLISRSFSAEPSELEEAEI